MIYQYSNHRAEDLNEIVDNSLFSEIINYFYENKETDILLRPLKKHFSKIDNFEFFLEKLIELNLIQRKNRRYTLNFPIFNTKKTIELSDDIKKILEQIIEEHQDMQLEFFLGELIWTFFFNDNTSYFFGACNSEIFYQKKTIQSSSLSLISILPKNNSVVDLATYFETLMIDNSFSSRYIPLLELIGDVSSDYYLAQIKKIIRKPQIKKINTIFEQSLLLTGSLIENNTGFYNLVTPVLVTEDTEQLTALNISCLKQLLSTYWLDINNVEEQAYIKNSLFQSILTYLNWPYQQPITYFIIH